MATEVEMVVEVVVVYALAVALASIVVVVLKMSVAWDVVVNTVVVVKAVEVVEDGDGIMVVVGVTTVLIESVER